MGREEERHGMERGRGWRERGREGRGGSDVWRMEEGCVRDGEALCVREVREGRERKGGGLGKGLGA